MENNGEISGPLTSLPIDRLNCNADALAKKLYGKTPEVSLKLDRLKKML